MRPCAATVAALRERLLVAQPVALGAQGGLLGLGGRRGLDLLELEGEQVQLAVAGAGQLAQLGGAALELAHSLIGGAQPLAQRLLVGAAVGVEQLELGGGEHQLAVLVLAVERQQPAAELLQVGLGGGAPAHVGAGATVGPHPAGQHDLLGVGGQALGARQLRRQGEHPLDVGLGGAGPHDPAPRPAAEQQVQGVRQQRLAGAGLAGEHVQARAPGAARRAPSTAGSRLAVRGARHRSTRRAGRNGHVRRVPYSGVAIRPNFWRRRW